MNDDLFPRTRRVLETYRWIGRRRRAARRPPTLYQEMRRGSAIGALACLVFAATAGAAAPLLAGGALFGLGAGAVVGLVLWSGTAHLPEEPVAPPAPGQRR
jgi:hypothetical protein